jgi:hypothetical protein
MHPRSQKTHTESSPIHKRERRAGFTSNIGWFADASGQKSDVLAGFFHLEKLRREIGAGTVLLRVFLVSMLAGKYSPMELEPL